MADSWEDEEEKLAKQTQNVNLNSQPQVPTFQPGASSFTPGATFTPGASSFTPGQPFQQYGGGFNNQAAGYGQYYAPAQGFPQYGQPPDQAAGYPQYNQYGYQQTQQYGQQPPPAQRQAPVQIAKRPAAGEQAAPVPAAAPKAPKVLSISAEAAAPPKAKVLSLSAADTAAPKLEKTGGTKTLTISAPAPAKDTADQKATAAAKATEKAAESAKAASTQAAENAEAAKARTAEALEKEQAEEVDEATLAEMYGKEHVNVIFLGHVDAGKSTLGGSILFATGMVDERTMDKYKREAKEAGRETWYLSWALDLTKEERSKGKTVEVGRGFFETEKRRYSILDAPGHKTFVPNMIGGASQADVGVLVISARKGEYETGFEKGGQTREHAMLAKTQGVNKLIVVVNKMDDPTVEWSEERFKECTTKVLLFLKGVGYNPKTDIMTMPVSAQATLGIKNRIPKDVCPWYDGPSLLEYLDSMKSLERKLNAPFMMPIAAKYRDLGTMIEGKIESGILKKDQKYLMMPNRETIHISALYGETEDEMAVGTCGEQVRLRIRGVEEEDILPGYVLCSPKRPVHCVSTFEAQIVLLDIKSILSAGFNCVMHIHAAQEEVTFSALLHKLEKGTGRKSKKAPGFATRGMSIIARLQITGAATSICVERFEDYPQLGRFTLRDQGQTIAIGKITKLITDANA